MLKASNRTRSSLVKSFKGPLDICNICHSILYLRSGRRVRLTKVENCQSLTLKQLANSVELGEAQLILAIVTLGFQNIRPTTAE